jgi:hypothetical protein
MRLKIFRGQEFDSLQTTKFSDPYFTWGGLIARENSCEFTFDFFKLASRLSTNRTNFTKQTVKAHKKHLFLYKIV